MKLEELLKEVKEHAMENYGKGWDTLIECHSDDEVLEAIGKAKTRAGAIANVNKKLGITIYHEHRCEIEATAF